MVKMNAKDPREYRKKKQKQLYPTGYACNLLQFIRGCSLILSAQQNTKHRNSSHAQAEPARSHIVRIS
jgi:hypothetical protein